MEGRPQFVWPRTKDAAISSRVASSILNFASVLEKGETASLNRMIVFNDVTDRKLSRDIYVSSFYTPKSTESTSFSKIDIRISIYARGTFIFHGQSRSADGLCTLAELTAGDF
jgi:hypothetical protein